MIPATSILWHYRDSVLQSLYISPCIQRAMPNHLFGPEIISEELQDFIRQHDFPRLIRTFSFFWRGAATRFFNLPSARRIIQEALKHNLDDINLWLKDEPHMRFAFDYFGEPSDPVAGYGILEQDQKTLRFTKIVRIVLQRQPENKYVLWTAFPLLSPKHPCWLDAYDYDSHAPETELADVFEYFLNTYLTVTSNFLDIDAALQGAGDFTQFEPKETQGELRDTIRSLNPHRLSAQDERHLKYELAIRCLDETLPANYIETPAVLIAALQTHLG